MEQQPREGVDRWRSNVHMLKVGMGVREVERIMGFEIGLTLLDVRKKFPAFTGSVGRIEHANNGYVILKFDLDPSSARLISATVYREDKVIARLEKLP